MAVSTIATSSSSIPHIDSTIATQIAKIHELRGPTGFDGTIDKAYKVYLSKADDVAWEIRYINRLLKKDDYGSSFWKLSDIVDKPHTIEDLERSGYLNIGDAAASLSKKTMTEYVELTCLWHVREEMLRAKTDYVALKDEYAAIGGSLFDPSTDVIKNAEGKVEEYKVPDDSIIGRLQKAKKSALGA